MIFPSVNGVSMSVSVCGGRGLGAGCMCETFACDCLPARVSHSIPSDARVCVCVCMSVCVLASTLGFIFRVLNRDQVAAGAAASASASTASAAAGSDFPELASIEPIVRGPDPSSRKLLQFVHEICTAMGLTHPDVSGAPPAGVGWLGWWNLALTVVLRWDCGVCLCLCCHVLLTSPGKLQLALRLFLQAAHAADRVKLSYDFFSQVL